MIISAGPSSKRPGAAFSPLLCVITALVDCWVEEACGNSQRDRAKAPNFAGLVEAEVVVCGASLTSFVLQV